MTAAYIVVAGVLVAAGNTCMLYRRATRPEQARGYFMGAVIGVLIVLVGIAVRIVQMFL